MAFIVSLEVDEDAGEQVHAHVTTTIPTLMVEHHVLARDALKAEDYELALHQIEHIVEITAPPHQSIMQAVIEQIEEEDFEIALQTLEAMLEGVEIPEEHDSNADLRMALAWIIIQDFSHFTKNIRIFCSGF